jgi:hypothetical protein
MLTVNATGRPFNTQDDAAYDVLTGINSKSIADNREYGGLIFKNPSGDYGFTAPIAGKESGFTSMGIKIPEGSTLAGDYHTHADYSILVDGQIKRTSDPNFDGAKTIASPAGSNNFSSDDFEGIRKSSTPNGVPIPGYRGYVATPDGSVFSYDPSVGKRWRLIK